MNEHRAANLPLLWSIACVLALAVSALSSLPLYQGDEETLHDTYYVVAHWQFVLPIVAGFAFFAVFYLVVPRLLKRQANKRFALAHFTLVSLGVALVFAPMAYLAVVGPPQRYVDYVEPFAILNTVSTVGYPVAGTGVLLFLAVIYQLLWDRKRLGA